MFWKTLSIVAIVFALLAAPASAASPLSNLSQQLVCQCGCTLTVANCTHQECSSREEMTRLIVQKLDEGLSEPQVIQYFVAQYGEQVLASPTKKGFNLVAWILPFAVIIVGAAIIYLALKRWVWQGRSIPADASAADDADDEKYRLQLEKDLKNFAERGYR